jgi:citrate synthase
MGECNMDHSLEDVKNKYESQSDFLPEDIKTLFNAFLKEEHTQDILNDVFHLLKKYDLATDDEKETRNKRLEMVLKNV